MAGYNQFTKFILEHAKVHIGHDRENYRPQLAEVLGNVIFEMPGPRAVNRQLNAEQRFFRTVWNGFIEIQSAYEALKDFEVLIRRFPFANTRIKRTRYLRFVIESYLAEAYILKERMVAYLTTIGRLFRHHARHAAVLRQTRPMFDVVSGTLKPLTDLRSSHTHQLRFDSEELDRLGTLELLSSKGSDEEFEAAMTLAYDEAWGRYRRLWRKRISANNSAIGQLLDLYSGTLVEILFDANGALKPHAT